MKQFETQSDIHKQRRMQLILMTAWYILAVLCIVGILIGMGCGIHGFLHPDMTGERQRKPIVSLVLALLFSFVPASLGFASLWSCRTWQKRKNVTVLTTVVAVICGVTAVMGMPLAAVMLIPLCYMKQEKTLQHTGTFCGVLSIVQTVVILIIAMNFVFTLTDGISRDISYVTADYLQKAIIPSYIGTVSAMLYQRLAKPSGMMYVSLGIGIFFFAIMLGGWLTLLPIL